MFSYMILNSKNNNNPYVIEKVELSTVYHCSNKHAGPYSGNAKGRYPLLGTLSSLTAAWPVATNRLLSSL